MKYRQTLLSVRLFRPLDWLAAASSGWTALIVTAPLVPMPAALVAYVLGGMVCHQLPERSFHMAGHQLAVCARCTGIYTGAAVCLCWQWVRLSRACGPSHGTLPADVRAMRRWLAGGALPTIATVALEQLGLWQPSNLVRATAGVPLGVAVAFVVGRAATLHYGQWRQRQQRLV